MTKGIVLIDDDEDDLDLLEESLWDCGQTQCSRFTSPSKGLKAVTSELPFEPQFIFIDFNMPKLNGGELLKEFRDCGKLNNSIITIMSTSMPETLAKEMLQDGADFVLQKPTSVSEYHNLLYEVLSVTSRIVNEMAC